MLPAAHPYTFGLYVNTLVSQDAVWSLILRTVRAKNVSRLKTSLATAVASYYVGKNDEYDKARANVSDANAFLFYNFIVDVYPIGDQISDYLREVKLVIASLKSGGASVVPAGTHEAELAG